MTLIPPSADWDRATHKLQTSCGTLAPTSQPYVIPLLCTPTAPLFLTTATQILRLQSAYSFSYASNQANQHSLAHPCIHSHELIHAHSHFPPLPSDAYIRMCGRLGRLTPSAPSLDLKVGPTAACPGGVRKGGADRTPGWGPIRAWSRPIHRLRWSHRRMGALGSVSK